MPSPCEWVEFSTFACPRVRGAWKLDLLSGDGRTLDWTRREGGWGAAAQLMKDLDGGDWTARSLSSLSGMAKQLWRDEAAQQWYPLSDRPESRGAISVSGSASVDSYADRLKALNPRLRIIAARRSR